VSLFCCFSFFKTVSMINRTSLDHSGNNRTNSDSLAAQFGGHGAAAIMNINSDSPAAAMLRAAHAAQSGGGAYHNGATGDAGGGGNVMSSMFQQNQPQLHMQQQSPQIDPNGSGLNIANEIKRLQQLQQFGGGHSSNALLMNPGSGQHDPSTAAFLQILDSQQRGNSNRFEIPLVGSMGMSGAPVVGSMGMSGAPMSGPMIMSGAPLTGSMNMSEPNGGTNHAGSGLCNNVGSMNPPMQLPSNFFADARLLMAQNHLQQQAVAAMNFPGLQPQHMQPQQQLAQGGGVAEAPLPSPHSLFYRDGTRRMRGGVIEPFPVSCRGCWNSLCASAFA
jgi:hypothetical protein